MTTTFELASTVDTYLAFGINRVADPYAVYNSFSRAQSGRTVATTQAAAPRLDSADFSQASTLVAAALSDADLHTERIATLRLTIANGTYRVAASTVADSLLKSTLSGI